MHLPYAAGHGAAGAAGFIKLRLRPEQAKVCNRRCNRLCQDPLQALPVCTCNASCRGLHQDRSCVKTCVSSADTVKVCACNAAGAAG